MLYLPVVVATPICQTTFMLFASITNVYSSSIPVAPYADNTRPCKSSSKERVSVSVLFGRVRGVRLVTNGSAYMKDSPVLRRYL